MSSPRRTLAVLLRRTGLSRVVDHSERRSRDDSRDFSPARWNYVIRVRSRIGRSVNRLRKMDHGYLLSARARARVIN